jgi:hypothetical protein
VNRSSVLSKVRWNFEKSASAPKKRK